MTNVLLFGATGHVGRHIAAELKRKQYHVTAVVRNEEKARQLGVNADRFIIKNVLNAATLRSICEGQEIVISALGKSVSPNDKSKPSFYDVDYTVNAAIVKEAIKSRVSKFIYVSALGSERYPQLQYFKAHYDVEKELMTSGINYSIIKPPAVFSAFLDVIDMAKKGQLATIGKGECFTNPIDEGDLAKICVDAIGHHNSIIEAGGKEILSRKQINEMIQREAAAHKKVRTVPLGLIKTGLPVLKIISKNLYDKMAFFTEVMQHDVIAPQVGEKRLESYIRSKV
jgi:uncharacterized protein YbjT (DUF2867 family)